MIFRASIYGDPIPQPRHRVSMKRLQSGRVIVGRHLPNKSDGSAHPVIEWKARIREEAQRQARAGFEMFKRPAALKMMVNFYFSRPASMSKKLSNAHYKRPDLDNLVKAVKDALQGVIYEDDSQVARLYAKKEYTEGKPGINIIIRRWRVES